MMWSLLTNVRSTNAICVIVCSCNVYDFKINRHNGHVERARATALAANVDGARISSCACAKQILHSADRK